MTVPDRVILILSIFIFGKALENSFLKIIPFLVIFAFIPVRKTLSTLPAPVLICLWRFASMAAAPSPCFLFRDSLLSLAPMLIWVLLGRPDVGAATPEVAAAPAAAAAPVAAAAAAAAAATAAAVAGFAPMGFGTDKDVAAEGAAKVEDEAVTPTRPSRDSAAVDASVFVEAAGRITFPELRPICSENWSIRNTRCVSLSLSTSLMIGHDGVGCSSGRRGRVRPENDVFAGDAVSISSPSNSNGLENGNECLAVLGVEAI